jgi:hypothetical protein
LVVLAETLEMGSGQAFHLGQSTGELIPAVVYVHDVHVGAGRDAQRTDAGVGEHLSLDLETSRMQLVADHIGKTYCLDQHQPADHAGDVGEHLGRIAG